MDKVNILRWDVRLQNINTGICFDFVIWQEKYDILTLVEFFENAYKHHVITAMRCTPLKE